MKSLINSFAVVAALTIPVASFAQSNNQITRAQVRGELVQLEKAGFHVGEGDQASYPTQIQAATARVAVQKAADDFGGVSTDSSAAGAPVNPNVRSLYSGH